MSSGQGALFDSHRLTERSLAMLLLLLHENDGLTGGQTDRQRSG